MEFSSKTKCLTSAWPSSPDEVNSREWIFTSQCAQPIRGREKCSLSSRLRAARVASSRAPHPNHRASPSLLMTRMRCFQVNRRRRESPGPYLGTPALSLHKGQVFGPSKIRLSRQWKAAFLIAARPAEKTRLTLFSSTFCASAKWVRSNKRDCAAKIQTGDVEALSSRCFVSDELCVH